MIGMRRRKRLLRIQRSFIRSAADVVQVLRQWSYSCHCGYVPTTFTFACNEDTVRRLGGQQHRNDTIGRIVGTNSFVAALKHRRSTQADRNGFVQQGSRYMFDISRVYVGELATRGLCQRADVAV
jgi:hypothetical protein